MSMNEVLKGLVEEAAEILGDQSLASKLPPGKSLRLAEIDPKELGKLASEAQRNLVYAYTFLAARQEARLKPLANRARERLGVASEFHDLMERAHERSMELRAKVPLANLLLDTPQSVRAALTRVIRRHHRLSAPIEKTRLPGINPSLYENVDDRFALDIVKGIPGTQSFIRYIVDKFVRVKQLEHISSHIEVTASTMPEIYKIYRTAAQILEIEKPPALYVMPGLLDAFTTGAENPIIVVTQGIVSLLTSDELMFVLGHELGHLKSGHVLYSTAARWIGTAASVVGESTIGIGKLVIDVTLAPALNLWSRRSELTADRAGLLACQDLNAAISCFAKLAGLPACQYGDFTPADFLLQASRLDQALASEAYARAATLLDVMTEDHPRLVWRAAELQRWVKSGEYEDILSATTEQRQHLAKTLGNDPLIAPFLSEIIEAITSWGSETASTDMERIRTECRRMIRLGAAPSVRPLDKVFAVEAEVSWASGGELTVKLHLLVLQDGTPARVSLTLAKPLAWSRLPNECREAMIRQKHPAISYRLFSRGG